MRMMRPVAVCSAVALSALAACTAPPVQHRELATSPPPLDRVSDAARTSPLAASMPAALLAPDTPMRPEETAALTAFYVERDYAPLWFDGGAYAAVRTRLAPALLGEAAGTAAPSAAPSAAREVALSLAALRLDATAADGPAVAALTGALARRIEAAAPAPADAVPFGGQRAAIARYRTIVAAGGWPVVPPGEPIEPGDRAPELDRLRERLAATGDLGPAAGHGDVYDAALVAAVERFQGRHGLAVDGVVGPATRRALNVPADERLAQLERARAVVADVRPRRGERYVVVNVPAFELRYVEAGEVALRSAVVVGSVDNPTPVFTDTIEYLVFNPYWHVPRRIAREELVFDFKEDPAAMAARGFQLVDAGGTATDPTRVDWTLIEPASLPFRVRQGPGSANALGRVKFMFPNEHAVYLHDTPARHLFERPARAFSHGCVRVAQPLALAERLLAAEGYGAEAIRDWVAADATRRVALGRPVPVHLIYVTAWMADGRVQFRPDLYDRRAAPAS
jgi:murein L,D-transpeptidase YcbB/YkuD